MGFAKYHEDDLGIFYERMYYRQGTALSSVLPAYTRMEQTSDYHIVCPLCGCLYSDRKQLITHVLKAHGGKHEIVYLNHQQVSKNSISTDHVTSLEVYSFREKPTNITLQDESGRSMVIRTRSDQYEYDIEKELRSRQFAELQISGIDTPVHILHRINIGSVTLESIRAGRYKSSLFDEQFADELLSPEQCLTYFKMLIHEKTDTRPCIQRLEQIGVKWTRSLGELDLYCLMQTGKPENVEDRIPADFADGLIDLLNGNYTAADRHFSQLDMNDNDCRGCRICLDLLRGDALSYEYLIRGYRPNGIIGYLEQVLYWFTKYEKDHSTSVRYEIDELSLFSEYPVIHALQELYFSQRDGSDVSSESYSLLRNLTPVAAAQYCRSIDDPAVREKVLRSAVKKFSDSSILKTDAFGQNYDWLKKKITVSDGPLYRKALDLQNRKMGSIFSEKFLEQFPCEDHIKITPLGGEKGIGASCFVLSYRGYNIMLDCGIDPQKKSDDAMPALDSWKSGIDVIIVSHAHIDHSGALPKAHTLWPEARILVTVQTKVYLTYLFADMAKVRNGVTDEFEIENIAIEKQAMTDTLNSMTTVDFEQQVRIGDHIQICLHPSGHLVGAAMIEVRLDDRTVLYTGDFCDFHQSLANRFDYNLLPHHVDYLITEATYYQKASQNFDDQKQELQKAILDAVHEKKAVLLPAAAIGRSQELVCIVGEMKLAGQIPQDTPLYLGGMAIMATTQLVPCLNDHYRSIVSLFQEVDKWHYPEKNAIVIASSGSMSRGSAACRIAQYWDSSRVPYRILANGFLDEDTEPFNRAMMNRRQIERHSLSTHASRNGILELIRYLSPEEISIVHRGNGSDADLQNFEKLCRDLFDGDLLIRKLSRTQTEKVFDIYDWLLRQQEG